MSGTDEPRHPGAIIEDSDTDTEEVPATTGVSDTEETPVTTDPLPRDSRGRFVSRSAVPDPPPPPRVQTPPPPLPAFNLSARSLSYLSTPTRELITGLNPTMDAPTGSASGTTTTKPSEKKGKQPANTSQHSNSTKRGFAPSYKLGSIPKLSGSENYRTWRDISEYVLQLFNCWDLVVGTEEIPEEETDDEGDVTNFEKIDEYRDRYQYASAYFLETIEPQWLILLATHKTPPAIWQAFEDKFARENTSSFFDQLNSVFDTKYDTLDLLSDHINKYDTLWNRLHLRCSTATSSDRYTLPFAFQSVFESPEAKAAILLRSLPESMNNIVDNLQTKEDLTYDHVYNKLMDLKVPTAVNSADNKAYKSADVRGKGKETRREPSRKGPTATTKECTYCKKHFPTARSEGHTWNECSKLKAANLKNKEKKTVNSAKIGKEETPEPVSTLSSTRTTTKISPYPRWVIDTGASSHMTNNSDLFIDFETIKGTVR